MLTAAGIIEKYISFFEKRGHKRIPSASLIPENDPTTLFTSSGMQPLVSYLLGQPHPQGKRLVNVQNCFRAQDIDEVGDNRHTTFFRMLGNWSLGDYFKKEQLSWCFEFLTKELSLDPNRLYVSVFNGYQNIPKDEESASIWKNLFESVGLDPKERIHFYGAEENWWSRSGEPEAMPVGEPGGPDSEVFFDFYPEQEPIGNDLKKYSHNGRLLEIGNSVFMQYKKLEQGFEELPQKNVDFGGGLERLLAAAEHKQDVFQTNLFSSIIRIIEQGTERDYRSHKQQMRVITDHLIAACFMIAAGVKPSNKEQGYILRRLIRRAIDNFETLTLAVDFCDIIETIIEQYKKTDPYLPSQYENILLTVGEEQQAYRKARDHAYTFISKKYKRVGDELMGVTEISADDAFTLFATHGLSPTQIKSLGYTFDDQAFAQKMQEHQRLSKKGAEKKFAGGLADHGEQTIKGHTATHLLHQALRDVLGSSVYQTGSNITAERVRFDFNFDRKLNDEEIKKVEEIVNDKIRENLPVHFEIMTKEAAKKMGAIGLFEEAYADSSKIYFIGPQKNSYENPYSVEFCGGPHVDFTGRVGSFKMIKQENLGRGQRRIYAVVGK